MAKLSQEQFDELMNRIRNGDQLAATELVRMYESEIRREVRLRLTDSGMRRTLDSMDVCQSVFGNFFVKTAIGELQIDRPEQLLRLLSQMAKNKLIDRHRRHQVRQPPKNNRIVDVANFEPACGTDSPSQVVAAKEMLGKLTKMLTMEENRIVELRRAGQTWDEIADQLNDTAEAIRKRFSRARARVTRELGMS